MLSHPGHKKDDAVLYGEGGSTDPITSTTHGTAIGSDTGPSSNTAGTSGTTSGTTGSSANPGQSQFGTDHVPLSGDHKIDPMSNFTDPAVADNKGFSSSSGAGAGTGNPSSPSRFPRPVNVHDDISSTASVKSGIPGASQTSPRLTNEPDINKPLPREPGTTGTSGTGTGRDLTGSSYPDRSVDKSVLS